MSSENESQVEKNEFGLPAIGILGEILFNPFLSHAQKILFGYIRALSKTSRGCWATNAVLGEYISCDKISTSAMIAKLERFGYIIISRVIKKDGEEERRIYENPKYPEKYLPLVNAFHDDKTNYPLLTRLKGTVIDMVLKNEFPEISWQDIGIDILVSKKRKPTEEEIKSQEIQIANLASEIEGYKGQNKEGLRVALMGVKDKLNHIKILDNDSNTDIEEVSKDTIIGPSDQPTFFSQSSSRRKLPSNNNPPQKEKQIPSRKEHIVPGDWKKLAVDTWNKIPNINHHTDMTTKTMERVSEYLDRMTQGTFFNLCHIDQDFIKNNKIPQWWERDHKAFSQREILNAIRNFALYYDDAYWPANKKTLPKSLDTFIYNPPNQWSKNGELHKKQGSSFLLRCIANPNIEPMRVCKDFNPQYTQYFAKKQLLQYFKEDDLPNVYRGIQAIETRVISDKVFDFANGSTNPDLKRAIGVGPGKLEPMFEKYANYLAHEYNRLEPERMFSRYGYFQDFLEYLKEEYSGFRVRI